MNFPRNLFLQNAKRESHSELFLKETLNYVDSLTQKDLPVLFSLKHLSILLEVELPYLNNILSKRGSHYSYYLIKKKRGGYRKIVAPFSDLKRLQNWIKINILDKIEISKNATGFCKGKSILDNAKMHENQDVILNVDLLNFFESITEKRVYGIFKSIGYHPNLSVDLAKICTAKIPYYKFEDLTEIQKKYFESLAALEDCVLPQGASTSPQLSNLVCQRLDYRLARLANSLGANYSRYADDITFSGKDENIPNLNILKKIIEDEGFLINWQKVGKYRKGQRQLVTGLHIDSKIRIPKKFKKNIYRHLHFCKKFGAYSHFQRINPNKGYRKEWLLGKIYFVKAIEPEEAEKMMNIVEQINWEI